MRMILSSLASLALIALPGLLTSEVQAKSDFVLEDYFVGKTVARGVFISKIAGVRREFDVYLTGKWDGTTLSLREDFVFDDGEKDRKTWTFVKVGEGRYTGTREDLVGVTNMTIVGNEALFDYDVLLPRKGKEPVKVHFQDKMIFKEDGTIENRARVSKFGLGIGRVAVNFVRGSNLEKVPSLPL